MNHKSGFGIWGKQSVIPNQQISNAPRSNSTALNYNTETQKVGGGPRNDLSLMNTNNPRNIEGSKTISYKINNPNVLNRNNSFNNEILQNPVIPVNKIGSNYHPNINKYSNRTTHTHDKMNGYRKTDPQTSYQPHDKYQNEQSAQLIGSNQLDDYNLIQKEYYADSKIYKKKIDENHSTKNSNQIETIDEFEKTGLENKIPSNLKILKKEENLSTNKITNESSENNPEFRNNNSLINENRRKKKLGNVGEDNIWKKALDKNESKPKIDLKKVDELEKKRKKIIENIEEKRERSYSPISVNMIKNIKPDEPKEINNSKSINSYVPKDKNFKNLPTIEKAKLTLMCNPKEMKEREEQSNLSIFEADPESSFYDNQLKKYILKVKPEYAIKLFARPAADTVMDDPENIRTPEVLTKTINYILDKIIDADYIEEKKNNFLKSQNHEIDFKNIATFVEDRFRSIRQDYIILDLKGDKNCIDGHEKIARFLILCLNECLDYDAFSGHQGLFKLIIQQLNATLTSIREFYKFVNDNKSHENEDNINFYFSPNQGEFFSYSILLSIKEKFDLVSMLNKIPEYIKSSKLIKLTKRIVRAIIGNDWINFFSLLKSSECGYLTSCIASLYFKEMRSAALHELARNSDIKIKDSIFKTTLNNLIEILSFEDKEECLGFLDWFGIDLSLVDHSNPNSVFELVKIGIQGEEANLSKNCNRRIIENKRQGATRRDVIMYVFLK